MENKDWDVWLKTEEELLNYIHDLENQPMTYNSSAEVVTKATIAMFNYMTSKVGLTGFQAGWAGMKFIQVIRNMDAPFMIVDGSKMLYPQYDLKRDVDEFIKDIRPELGKIAKQKLEEGTYSAHPNVIKRWEELAKYVE